MKLSLWTRYRITLRIKNRIVGGIPTNPDLIKGWIAANMPAASEAEKEKLAAKTIEDLGSAAEEKAEGMWTTFKRKDGALCIESRGVKAMFKEASNILRDMLTKAELASKKGNGEKDEKKKDEKKSKYTNLKAKLAERLFVEDDLIPILRDGKTILKPDVTEERAIHVMTAQGPRTALKRYDAINAPATVQFTVRHLREGLVDRELIETLLEYSGWNGLGADRSQGNGLFEVVEIQPLDDL